MLLVLVGSLAAKVLPTSLTIWVGGSWGVSAPSLFMDAILGSAYGAVVDRLLPHLAAAYGAYGLVGLGAGFAAAARTSITAVIIVFELTGDYNVILPLMFAIVVAAALSNVITRDTIYALKLRRRGIDVAATRSTNLMRQIKVSDAMGLTPRALTPEQPLTDLIDRFAAERPDSLPVIARDHKLIGVVAAGDVEQAIAREAETRVLRQLSRAKIRCCAPASRCRAPSKRPTTKASGARRSWSCRRLARPPPAAACVPTATRRGRPVD